MCDVTPRSSIYGARRQTIGKLSAEIYRVPPATLETSAVLSLCRYFLIVFLNKTTFVFRSVFVMSGFLLNLNITDNRKRRRILYNDESYKMPANSQGDYFESLC